MHMFSISEDNEIKRIPSFPPYSADHMPDFNVSTYKSLEMLLKKVGSYE